MVFVSLVLQFRQGITMAFTQIKARSFVEKGGSLRVIVHLSTYYKQFFPYLEQRGALYTLKYGAWCLPCFLKCSG